MHAMAHWKNKETMARNMLNQLQCKLLEHQDVKRKCRDRLHREVLRHNKLKKEKQNLRRLGCLMHYPALMKDYDECVDFSQHKRKVVRKLWVEHDRLERRVNAVERGAPDSTFIPGPSISPPIRSRNNSNSVGAE